jgi:predicted AlkP superfamily phosphohydrolase/phosphomutase
VREIIRKLVPGSLRRRLQKAAGSLPAPLESSETRAVVLPSDPNGYIRLNLKGREPNGSVEPGAEAEAELAEIRHQLFELNDPASGEKIVAEATTADEAFGADRHPDIPDLMVRFRDDLGTIEACQSERVGLLKIPFHVAHRTGDHKGAATLWIAGKRIEPTDSPGSANALDLAPTILSLLDVPIPAELDGNPVVESKRQGLTGAPRN